MKFAVVTPALSAAQPSASGPVTTRRGPALRLRKAPGKVASFQRGRRNRPRNSIDAFRFFAMPTSDVPSELR